nr:PREDICTED: dolichyl-diphosphooligosaccharide--protein glycosyltransferase subunit DAD1 [Haliaeetus albicilla]
MLDSSCEPVGVLPICPTEPSSLSALECPCFPLAVKELFLSLSCIGSFFLCHAVCLRIQINPQNKGEFQGISPERAFADFLFANTILHLVVINFVG